MGTLMACVLAHAAEPGRSCQMVSELPSPASASVISGLEQAQPDDAALPAPGRRLLQRHRAFVTPATVVIVSTVNDHVRDLPAWSCARRLPHGC
jgi:hypothetical protein